MRLRTKTLRRMTMVIVIFLLMVCIMGCRDRCGRLQNLIANGLTIDSAALSLSGIPTDGIDPFLLKYGLVRYFSTVDIGSFSGSKTCFLRLVCGERTDYIRRRERISGKLFVATDYFHIQSVAVQTSQYECSSKRTEESFTFFVRDSLGDWMVFSLMPFQNSLSTSGIGDEFSCVERCWMCRKMYGLYPSIPSFFMKSDFSDIFVVESDNLNAKLLYLSTEGIEMLKTDSTVRKLFLGGRTSSSMIFLSVDMFPYDLNGNHMWE